MLYRETRPEVTSVPGDPEPIRVTFGDVTLCLSETQASWLESNVGRVRRDLGRARGDCEVCGWPLASAASEGCVPGNCCYRPREGTDEYRRIEARRKALAEATR